MDLNTILIILGVIALLALIAHGIWSNRREKSQYFKNANTFSQNHQSNRFNTPHQPAQPITETPMSDKPTHSFVEETPPQQQTLDFEASTTSNISEPYSIERAVDEIKITLPNGTSNTTLNEVESTTPYSSHERPTQPVQPVMIQANTSFQSYDAPSSYAESNTATLSESNSRQTENEYVTPTISLNQTNEQHTANAQSTTSAVETASENQRTPDFIMLYVVAPENREFNGGRLAQALDSLGFIFGVQHIYHRHLDLTAASPVLFSVANLQQPGTFNPYDMDNLVTVGIAIFMQLPSPGNNLVNLKTMIRAARSLADELGGFVLTDKQEIFNDHAEQEYLAKVA